MASDGDYNGWANRESWLVALWLGGDEGAYRAACGAIGKGRCPEVSIEELVVSLLFDGDDGDDGGVPRSGLAADLLRQALARVDWRAVAASFVEE